ncbi:HAD domain-containing protein [Actinokineospora xionganensis]|uniref:Secreted protein n=1 Tax=Actinokineospora xionganensis TaxID=2684470 RepID=A0ABR7L3S2_9PSEU|nr:HAD domain-containing protein [Actinokineospora xionganensis]MBC6447335.1 hypothetical protein [Actinokineospora xionganensis]
MSRGLLLIDVDGPLNPFAAKPTRRPPGYETFRLTPNGGWHTGPAARRRGMRVWLRRDDGELLLRVAEDTGLELVWATTWMREANTYIGRAIGLPELPVIEFPDRDLRAGHGWRADGGWKWPAVAEYAAGRPLAWLDDELRDHRAFVPARTAFVQIRASMPTLLCHVDPRRGLRPAHLAEVRAWAADLTDPSA